MGGWWIETLWQAGARVLLLSWIVWIVIAISLHELGHGIAAIRQGDRTPIERGHMTWNPWIHMGPISLIAFAVMGLAWGLMPVDPDRFREGRTGEIKVALAGPAVNAILAALCLGLLALTHAIGIEGAALEILATFAWVGVYLNVTLTLFNLIPVPPLDGSRVLAGFSWEARRWFEHPNAPIFGLIGLFLLLRLGAIDAFFDAGTALASLVTDFDPRPTAEDLARAGS